MEYTLLLQQPGHKQHFAGRGKVLEEGSRRDTPLGGLTQAKRYRYICICGGQRASAGHQFRGTFDSGSCGLAGACKALISQCPFRSFLVLIVPASSCPLGPRATWVLQSSVVRRQWPAVCVGIDAVFLWSSAYAFLPLRHNFSITLKKWVWKSIRFLAKSG